MHIGQLFHTAKFSIDDYLKQLSNTTREVIFLVYYLNL